MSFLFAVDRCRAIAVTDSVKAQVSLAEQQAVTLPTILKDIGSKSSVQLGEILWSKHS